MASDEVSSIHWNGNLNGCKQILFSLFSLIPLKYNFIKSKVKSFVEQQNDMYM